MKLKRPLLRPLLFTLTALAYPLGSLHATPAPPSAEIQPAQKAELKLSYLSLRQLIGDFQTEKLNKKSPPPVSATLQSAHYQIDLSSQKTAQITATFSATSFAENWATLPLLKSGFAIQTVEPSTTVLVPLNGNLALLTEGKGSHQITITFLATAEPDGSYHLKFLPATAGQVQLSNSDGYVLQNATPSSSGTHVLPMEGGSLRIKPKRKTSAKPSTWAADARVLYSAKESELKAEARIQLTAKQDDDALLASLIFPKDARIIQVTGPDLFQWKENSLNGQSQVHLVWKTLGISRRRISVIYTLPLPDPDEIWTLTIPHLKKGEKTRGLLAIVTPATFHLTPTETVNQPPSSSAPDWMKLHGIPLMVKLPQVRDIHFKGKLLTEIHTATATIKSATFETHIVLDGSTLTEGEISISHRNPKRWKFKLPKGSQILTCHINDSPANPILQEDGSLQLSLPTRQGLKTPISKIRLSFTSQLEKIQPIEGKLSLTLPSTPLFIHELQWKIILPNSYETSAIDGNLTFSPRKNSGQWIELTQRLARNNPAHIDLFYRKQNH